MERILIESRDITDKLKHKVSLSGNESMVYLQVDYLNGKFTIEKSYKNNRFDLEEMTKQANSLNTEEKVRKYLKLEEASSATNE